VYGGARIFVGVLAKKKDEKKKEKKKGKKKKTANDSVPPPRNVSARVRGGRSNQQRPSRKKTV